MRVEEYHCGDALFLYLESLLYEIVPGNFARHYLVDKSKFKCKSRGMETCLHSRGAALNARETGI